MGQKYKAIVGLSYPDAASLKLIPKGGVSKLSPEEKSKIKYKNVKAGKVVDDIPDGSIKWLLKDGAIVAANETVANKKGAKK